MTLILLLAYALASVPCFGHNSSYLASYPNVPCWISRVEVYGALLAVIGVGGVGYLLLRFEYRVVARR